MEAIFRKAGYVHTGGLVCFVFLFTCFGYVLAKPNGTRPLVLFAAGFFSQLAVLPPGRAGAAFVCALTSARRAMERMAVGLSPPAAACMASVS